MPLNYFIAPVFITVSVLLSSCASNPAPVDPKISEIKSNEDARKYNMALLKAIQNADSIVVKEHSHVVDFLNIIPELEAAPDYTYKVKELSIGEKVLFMGEVRSLKGVADDASSDCLFVSHHTIDFYHQGELESSMKICYKCDKIKWDGSSINASKDVFDALTPMIIRAGMQKDRNWEELAKMRYEQENKVTPPEPNPDKLVKPGGVPVAKWAPGQKGKKVINPFTGRLVDVEGIPANTKVRDPNDRDPTHIFRVPN